MKGKLILLAIIWISFVIALVILISRINMYTSRYGNMDGHIVALIIGCCVIDISIRILITRILVCK